MAEAAAGSRWYRYSVVGIGYKVQGTGLKKSSTRNGNFSSIMIYFSHNCSSCLILRHADSAPLLPPHTERRWKPEISQGRCS